jgi:hypothetical protein
MERRYICPIIMSSPLLSYTKLSPANKIKKATGDIYESKQISARIPVPNKSSIIKQQPMPTTLRSGDRITLLVAGGEDDGASLVADDALGDAGHASRGGGGGAGAHAARDGVGADDLDEEVVAVGARLEPVHLDEDGLPERRLLAALRRRIE